ncbi:ABC-three component system middle component 6 [Fibrobacter sp.]|uniref:ABC-three component system middle component 6 n=1 Tax=Fibrobacter sp. TaxID=35828 RepID=UPI00345BBE10
MLLPDNIHPEDCIYYNGSIVLEIVQQNKHISLADLFAKVREKKTLSYSMFLLCLDWLFLINAVLVNEGIVSLCS